MSTRKSLGRGLDVLLPEKEKGTQIAEVSLNDIDPNPNQPRRSFDKEGLEMLAESLRQNGVLQPLIVVRKGNRYKIVAGERRFRAARIAGLVSVPCIVREMDEQKQLETALVENLQREDLNPLEEAFGIQELMDSCGLTQENAAVRIGRSRSAVANILRILALPEEMQEMVRDGRLSVGHAKVLAGIKDPAAQYQLALRICRDALSVRETEKLAILPDKKPAGTSVKTLLPELEDMRVRFQMAVGVRAAMTGGLKKGKIILQYNTSDELEAIYSALERLEKNS